MIRAEHLSVYDLTLTTRAPLHVGSGSKCAKTDYLYNPRTQTVSMLDPDKLLPWLLSRRLEERYERFILSGNTNMFYFFRDCGISDREIEGLCMYRVNASDALDDSHSLKEIWSFVRDSRHRAYIPGSSVKGALRTVLLATRMTTEKKGSWPDAQNKSQRARQMQSLEGQYLNTMPLKRDRAGNLVNDPVNSLLRGISISDSAPIRDEDLILVGKIDANEKGEYKKLPLSRECIRPGTELHFKLTLDHAVLRDGDPAAVLMERIRAFDRFYQRNVLSRFTPPSGCAAVDWQDVLILGGGAGFFAKTLAYPYLGMQQGSRYTQKIMTEPFSKHRHEQDIEKHGISPHTMKYGQFQGKLYPYGVCGVKIE